MNLSHSANLFSIFIKDSIALYFLLASLKLVSSAKCIIMALLNTELMKSKNKSGPNVDHRGTPHLIDNNSEEGELLLIR